MGADRFGGYPPDAGAFFIFLGQWIGGWGWMGVPRPFHVFSLRRKEGEGRRDVFSFDQCPSGASNTGACAIVGSEWWSLIGTPPRAQHP